MEGPIPCIIRQQRSSIYPSLNTRTEFLTSIRKDVVDSPMNPNSLLKECRQLTPGSHVARDKSQPVVVDLDSWWVEVSIHDLWFMSLVKIICVVSHFMLGCSRRIHTLAPKPRNFFVVSRPMPEDPPFDNQSMSGRTSPGWLR